MMTNKGFCKGGVHRWRIAAVAAACLLPIAPALSGEADEKPLLAGFHADPSICRVGQDYYMAFSSFTWYPGIPVYHSRDLRHWKLVSHVLADEEWRKLLTTQRKNDSYWGAFAPTIRHHEGRFYVICNVNQIRRIFATADRAEGPWKVVEAKRAGADPSLYFDEDGTCWECHLANPSVQEYKADTVSYLQKYDPATASPIGDMIELPHAVVRRQAWAEGAHIYKFGGRYLLFQAEGGTGFSHSQTAMWADRITGPYLPQTDNNPVLTRRHRGYRAFLQGAGHCDLVDTPEGKLYAVFHARRFLLTDDRSDRLSPLGRECFMCPAEIVRGTIFCYDDELVEGSFEDFEGDYYETTLPGVRLKRAASLVFTEDRTITTSKDGEGAALVYWRTRFGYFALRKNRDEIVLEEHGGEKTEVVGRLACMADRALLRVKVDHCRVEFFAGADAGSLKPVGGVRDIKLVCDNKYQFYKSPGVGTYIPPKE